MARRRVAGGLAFNTKHTLILLYGHLHRVGSGNVSEHQVPAAQLSLCRKRLGAVLSLMMTLHVTAQSVKKQTQNMKFLEIVKKKHSLKINHTVCIKTLTWRFLKHVTPSLLFNLMWVNPYNICVVRICWSRTTFRLNSEEPNF